MRPLRNLLGSRANFLEVALNRQSSASRAQREQVALRCLHGGEVRRLFRTLPRQPVVGQPRARVSLNRAGGKQRPRPVARASFPALARSVWHAATRRSFLEAWLTFR